VAYEIKYRPAALRELNKIPADIRRRINSMIGMLSADPRPPGAAKMAGRDGFWRVRLGDYRVVYEIHDGNKVVRVFSVGHRSDIYRN